MVKRKINYPTGVVVKSNINTRLSDKKPPVASKTTKYGNIKTVKDGLTFDSIAEQKYYDLHKNENVHFQVPFMLQDGFRLGDKKYRAINYIADFVFYNDDGSINKVVDVKGVRTDVFNIKSKMFTKRYGKPIYLAKQDKKTGLFTEERA